ncbi:MAG: hypothetical protein HXY36_06105 [Chloroflexi bacterium]|nr:hypothetical protein [Chloroflexota bacterium]
MDTIIYKENSAIVRASSGDETAVKERLRTLLQLAIAIGRREGLLGKGTAVKDPEVSTKGGNDGNKRRI